VRAHSGAAPRALPLLLPLGARAPSASSRPKAGKRDTPACCSSWARGTRKDVSSRPSSIGAFSSTKAVQAHTRTRTEDEDEIGTGTDMDNDQ
jgi:hypothetical protein